ncbi:hypothetical protein [Actinoplanes solisilvae]|uniref:hypothetical protein n=1 Tax=Actinoplanes solisilvae TaxID=2486853 RepID=UPI000FDB9E04|nr:hypothetical protein [Actinoplanes solisilvae]
MASLMAASAGIPVPCWTEICRSDVVAVSSRPQADSRTAEFLRYLEHWPADLLALIEAGRLRASAEWAGVQR